MTKNNYPEDNKSYIIDHIFLGILIGAFLTTIIFMVVYPNLSDFGISNETAHDICFQFTNNTAVEPSTIDGKLICKLPSFDHIQNIIIKNSNYEGEK